MRFLERGGSSGFRPPPADATLEVRVTKAHLITSMTSTDYRGMALLLLSNGESPTFSSALFGTSLVNHRRGTLSPPDGSGHPVSLSIAHQHCAMEFGGAVLTSCLACPDNSPGAAGRREEGKWNLSPSVQPVWSFYSALLACVAVGSQIFCGVWLD